MSDTPKAEIESWWARLARQTEQERAEERAQTAQDRADRMRAGSQEQQTEQVQRRRKGLRP